MRSVKLKTMAAFMAACISVAASQPIGCTDDTECSSGFYCETSFSSCKECLHCDSLNREPPSPSMPCVKSVLECGPCYKGLVMDFRLDQRACVPPTTQEDAGLPSYIWILIGLAIALVISLIAFFIFILFKRGNIMHILKIRATTSVSPSAAAAPSAPEQPPPAYDDVYAPDRAASPDPAYNAHATEEDALRPFIKSAPAAPGGGQRQAAGRQAALPFNNPSYVRGPPSNIQSEDSEPASPFSPYDEETMESFWSPHEATNNNTITNTEGYTVTETAEEGAAVAGALVRTRRASTEEGPPAKALCVRQESTGSEDGQHGTEETARVNGGSAASGVVFYINNVTNVNLPH